MTSSNNKKNTQANDFEDISEIIKALNISTDDFAIRTTRFWKINFAPGSSR
ncbi:BnaA03g50550D [Brassica napus]|uniref:BnaA03g50550D protein n=1 Tax=Brassica napus TaxID=3708 RepID=A0A078D4W0_BRANA|nr:BnaA03g50550D [Brassica napus]